MALGVKLLNFAQCGEGAWWLVICGAAHGGDGGGWQQSNRGDETGK